MNNNVVIKTLNRINVFFNWPKMDFWVILPSNFHLAKFNDPVTKNWCNGWRCLLSGSLQRYSPS